MVERPTYTNLGKARVELTLPAGWTYTTIAISRRKYDHLVYIHDSLYSDEEVYLRNSQEINEFMENAVDGSDSTTMDPQGVPVTVTVEFFYSTVEGQDISDLVETDANRSGKVQFVKFDKPSNAPKGIHDYMTLYVFVLDSAANEIENTPYNDMVLVVNMTYRPLTSDDLLDEPNNPNPDPPPPHPNTKPGYNPYLNVKRPSTLKNYLKYYDTVFLIDDSGSMAEGNPTKWEQTVDALSTISDTAIDYDTDGIDIYFLNSDAIFRMKEVQNINDKSKVREVLAKVGPGGGTPTGERLRECLQEHLAKIDDVAGKNATYREIKPLDLIVITDGSPNDNNLCKTVLENAAKHIVDNDYHPNHIGVEFVQIGEDPGAKERLAELAQANVNGMVDTVPYKTMLSGDDLKRILLGGMHPNLRVKQNNP